MGDGLMLTQQERDKFAAWLEREAESAKGLLEQFKKIPGQGIGDAIEKKFKTEIISSLEVAKKLRSIEGMTLG